MELKHDERKRAFKKILVVDDDPVSRDLLEEVLKKEGFAVHLAESGEQALQVLAREDFPLILSDVRMKEKTGFDLLRDIQKRPPPPSVVVLMTGFGSMGARWMLFVRALSTIFLSRFRLPIFVRSSLVHASTLNTFASRRGPRT